jgi:putative salt-induced outer membrane protein
MTNRALLVPCLLLVPIGALADPTASPTGVWTGKGQVGFIASQGNTDAKSGNAAIDLALLEDPWKHALHFGGLYSENAGITSAERWDALWQSNRDLTPDLYAFGALRYARDMFSGFQYQASATAGVGYKILDTSDVKLSAQLGAGYRKERPEQLVKNASGAVVSRVLQSSDGEAIATAGLDYSQVLTSTTTLSDKLLVESGSSNTLVTNALALAVKMSDRLALSLGYNLQNNTHPPAGLKKLDRSETLNLVFAF